MIRYRYLCLFFCICSLHFFAQKFELVYSFANVNNSSGSVAPGPLPEVEGLAVHTFSAWGLSSNPNASGRFSYTGWPTGAIDAEDNYAHFSGALSPFCFYEVTLSVQPGYTLSLTNLRFSARRSGTGIRHFCVRSDADNFQQNLPASTGVSSKLAVVADDVFFWKSDAAPTSSDQRDNEITFGKEFALFTGDLHIRFFAWNAESKGGSFSIDDVVFSGTLADSALLSSLVTELPQVCRHFADATSLHISCPYTRAELWSADGRRIMNWSFMEEGETVDLHELAPGVYVLGLERDGFLTRHKIIVRGS